ncbi:amidase [Umezawaea endophytica]|uniref:Amidase n=1 Tax=Umezawaea endophytica TaxID=1654476 RepID=A0A9X2VUU2_9PSEU|nr:amidase [Umezawaea endophytica]MCS7482454.1 amidase [Umezawaea endophytica]
MELTTHYLNRIEKINPLVGAFAAVAPEAALHAAEIAERSVLDGSDLSPLHGVCTAIKDLNFTAGMPAAFGSAAIPHFVPEVDDNVTSLARAAGMVILGKTTTAEFGAACYTETAVAPPARTPWDTTKSAGGSSGGAGAAVAAGLVSLAQGSDSAGSIRIPASACGLVGLKPSRGRVSAGPFSGEIIGLFTNGVLARTALDTATMLDALAVPMPGDPFALPAPGTGFAEQTATLSRPLRVARFARPVKEGVAVAPECVEAWEVASATLQSLGHRVEDVDCPFPPEVEAVFRTLFSVSVATVPLDPAQEQLLQPLTRWLRGQGETVSATQLTRTIATAQQMARRAVAAFADHDVVLSPTLALPPVPLGFFRNDEHPDVELDGQAAFNPFAPLYNLTGQPAVTVPVHWSEEGLPIGVMLAGRAREEGTLLGLVHQLEQELKWPSRHPPIW